MEKKVVENYISVKTLAIGDERSYFYQIFASRYCAIPLQDSELQNNNWVSGKNPCKIPLWTLVYTIYYKNVVY